MLAAVPAMKSATTDAVRVDPSTLDVAWNAGTRVNRNVPSGNNTLPPNPAACSANVVGGNLSVPKSDTDPSPILSAIPLVKDDSTPGVGCSCPSILIPVSAGGLDNS